jgi:hypothetical protein
MHMRLLKACSRQCIGVQITNVQKNHEASFSHDSLGSCRYSVLKVQQKWKVNYFTFFSSSETTPWKTLHINDANSSIEKMKGNKEGYRPKKYAVI